MSFRLKHFFVMMIALCLPLQQTVAAVMLCCGQRNVPAQVEKSAQMVHAMGHGMDVCCHHDEKSSTSSDNSGPANHGHTHCPFCAGFSLSQILPPPLTVPNPELRLANSGLANPDPWHIQFLTSGPERPPRT